MLTAVLRVPGLADEVLQHLSLQTLTLGIVTLQLSLPGQEQLAGYCCYAHFASILFCKSTLNFCNRSRNYVF